MKVVHFKDPLSLSVTMQKSIRLQITHMYSHSYEMCNVFSRSRCMAAITTTTTTHRSSGLRAEGPVGHVSEPDECGRRRHQGEPVPHCKQKA